jgi:cytochrome c biogenesis protein CcdA
VVLRIPLTLLLIFLGAVFLIEVFYNLQRGGWGKESETVTLIFKTPRCIKKLIRKAVSKDSLYLDFIVGALFSLIKMPCVLPVFMILYVYALLKPPTFAVNMLIFNLGVISPILILGSLVSVGVIRTSQLTRLRLRSRVIQRLAVGVAVIIAAIFLNY